MTTTQSHFRTSSRLAALLMLSLLYACGGTPTIEPPTSGPITDTTSEADDRAAQLELPISAYAPAFASADAALVRSDWMSATAALAALQEIELERDDADYLQYMLARVDYRRGQLDAAFSRLEQLDYSTMHPAIAYRLKNFERHMLSLQGRHLESARLGVRALSVAPKSDQAALKRSIWHALERSALPELQRAREQATDADWRGWLELAVIDNGSTLALGVELLNWQANYPEHAAAAPLPGGLEYLLEPTAAPETVALLLPLSGRLAPAGKAVRDGYLASYFHARTEGEAPGQIIVIDSARYDSAAEAYRQAIFQGAQLVVGPLSKHAVAELAAQAARPVPVVALNRIEQAATPAESALVQLSLAPEDEARQLAGVAFGQGARRALVLRPAGVWGDKIEEALNARWQALGGTLLPSVSYRDKTEYSAAMKSGLGITASEQRQRRLRDMLATTVEFTPRRRQDIDAVFMLSRTPEEARAIKPLLAFHYAGNLPVYATSNVHGGGADTRDRDLDGTRILELPWLLGSDPQLQQALLRSNGQRFTRLNALGTDAYKLQSRLRQLQAGPDALISGNTGLMTMNPNLQIERELPAAVFDGDELKPL